VPRDGATAKPYARFQKVATYRNNSATTNFNAIEAKVEQRLSRGIYLLAAYTHSKLIDDASSVFSSTVHHQHSCLLPAQWKLRRCCLRQYHQYDHGTEGHPVRDSPEQVGIAPAAAAFDSAPGQQLGKCMTNELPVTAAAGIASSVRC
jgi:hypothetical protein